MGKRDERHMLAPEKEDELVRRLQQLEGPRRADGRGRPRMDVRNVVRALLWMLGTGAPARAEGVMTSVDSTASKAHKSVTKTHAIPDHSDGRPLAVCFTGAGENEGPRRKDSFPAQCLEELS